MLCVNSLTYLIQGTWQTRVHYITKALLLNQHTKELVIYNSNIFTYFPVYILCSRSQKGN